MEQLGASLDAVYLQAAFEDDGAVHLVMELCAGGSVLERLAAGGCSERQAAHVMRAALRFLSQCHAKGVVYRDVKVRVGVLVGWWGLGFRMRPFALVWVGLWGS
jgi:calcium-dependent protein kinase